MSDAEILSLLPLIIVAGTAIVVMILAAFWRSHTGAAGVTVLGLVLAIAFSLAPHGDASLRAGGILIVDSYSLFFTWLFLAATLAVALFAHGYLKRLERGHGEFYVMLLLATLGAAVMAGAGHFVSFFLGLEILTVSLYVMIAYLKTEEKPLEAGAKYLILAATSSAFLLFGMALIYGQLGTMEFGQMATQAGAQSQEGEIFLLAGVGLTVVGIGFKLAVVPFHMWTPDVYQGAPAPVSAYIATVSKGAMLALLLRYFPAVGGYRSPVITTVFVVVSICSMFAGNLLALMQQSVKRLLAYSSISHLGYMLVAFVAGGRLAMEAIAFYLVTYVATMLGAFGIVSILSGVGEERDDIGSYRGLFWRRPWVAGAFTAVLLSLAGIPLTAGFIGKYYVLTAGVGSAEWTLVVVLVINSALGLFYYLRVVVAMLSPVAEVSLSPARLALAAGIVLSLLTLVLIWIGVYPSPVMQIVHDAVAGFSLPVTQY